MAIYVLHNYGPTRIVETGNGKSFTFYASMTWETKSRDVCDYITAHYPRIDLVDRVEAEPGSGLSDMTVKELRQYAEDHNVRISGYIKKADLIELLKEHTNGNIQRS